MEIQYLLIPCASIIQEYKIKQVPVLAFLLRVWLPEDCFQCFFTEEIDRHILFNFFKRDLLHLHIMRVEVWKSCPRILQESPDDCNPLIDSRFSAVPLIL